METISSSDDSSNDDDVFFDAHPGIKRSSSSHDGSNSITTAGSYSNNHVHHDHNDSSQPVASTSKVPYSPHKRVRRVPPAPPQGVKRANPNQSLSDLQPPAAGPLDASRTSDSNSSDSDASFRRQSVRPRKRRKSNSLPPDNNATGPSATDKKRNGRQNGSNSAPQRDKQRSRLRAQAKSRLSSSFNFVPSTQQLDEDGSGAGSAHHAGTHPLLVEIEKLRQAGNAHYRLHEYNAALGYYTQALEAYPKTITVPPPMSLLTNRAAAYISLGDWENALQDMLQALSYPCSDIEGNVKRLARYLRCLLALGKLEGAELTEGLKHAQNQLLLLQSNGGNTKLAAEGQKAVDDLLTAKKAYDAVSEAREKADWPKVLELIEDLIQAHHSSKRKAPLEWTMMHAEALGWLGKAAQAKKMVEVHLNGLPPNDARKLWFTGLFAYADAQLEQAVAALDALRLVTDLPTQASRLLHRAYNINNLNKTASKLLAEERPLKATSSYSEILRLALEEHPINRQIRLCALLKRAQAYTKAGNTASALEDFGAILKDDHLTESLRFDALVARGNLFLSLSNLNAGIKDLQVASTMDSVPRAVVRDLQSQIKKLKQPKVDKRRYRPDASPHEVLGLPLSASAADVRKAYKSESLKHHPDKGGDADIFKRISEAYNQLSTASTEPWRLRTRGPSRYR